MTHYDNENSKYTLTEERNSLQIYSWPAQEFSIHSIDQYTDIAIDHFEWNDVKVNIFEFHI